MLALIFVDMALGGLLKQIVLVPILYVVMLWGCSLKANCAGSLCLLIEFCCDALKQIVLAPIFTCLGFDGQAQKSKFCWPPFLFLFFMQRIYLLLLSWLLHVMHSC